MILRTYRPKNVDVIAVQWKKLEDHSEVFPFISTDPAQHGDAPCSKCGKRYEDHGFLSVSHTDNIICPGAWIIANGAGHIYPIADSVFSKAYEEVK